jgi:hypothetical protein
MNTVTEHGVEFTIRHEGRLKRSESVQEALGKLFTSCAVKGR